MIIKVRNDSFWKYHKELFDKYGVLTYTEKQFYNPNEMIPTNQEKLISIEVKEKQNDTD